MTHVKRKPKDTLTKLQIAKLRKLNKKLVHIELDIIKQVTKTVKRLNKAIKNTKEWFKDYEIDIKVHYYPKDSDGDPMATDKWLMLSYDKTNGKCDFGMYGDGKNHNMLRIRYPQQLKNDKHCYLMHGLYDHCGLDVDAILTIDEIFVDIKVIKQRSYKV